MPEQAPERVPTLEMRHVSKTFPGVKALNDVRLKAWGGEVHALMGENGAGKSTLMKILSGAYQPIRGRDPDRRADGRDRRPDRREAPGHRRHLSGAQRSRRICPSRRTSISAARSIAAACRPQVDEARLPAGARASRRALRPRDSSSTLLSIAEQQLVEIARALHANARILVMDEPTTALSSRETERLFDLMRQLRSDGLAHHLHQSPHGGDLRAVRPRLGAARRRLCRHPRAARDLSPKRSSR